MNINKGKSERNKVEIVEKESKKIGRQTSVIYIINKSISWETTDREEVQWYSGISLKSMGFIFQKNYFIKLSNILLTQIIELGN